MIQGQNNNGDASQYLQSLMEDANNKAATLQSARDRVAQVRQSGGNMMTELLRRQEPQRDTERIDRTKRAAKVNAWTNMITALGTGIAGLNRHTGMGYVPRINGSANDAMINNLNQLEEDYLTQRRDWNRLQLGAAQQQNADELAMAEQARREAQADYDNTMKRIYDTHAAEQERVAREKLEEKKHGYAMEEIEKRNKGSKEVAQIRATTSRNGSNGSNPGEVGYVLSDGYYYVQSKDLTPNSVNSIYEAMVADNPNLAATGSPIYGEDMKGESVIKGYKEPTLEQKRMAISEGIRKSKTAQQLLKGLGGRYGNPEESKRVSNTFAGTGIWNE